MRILTQKFIKLAFASVIALSFTACSLMEPSLQENMMTGEWEGEVSGFPVTLKFSETEFEVVGMGMTMPYTLEGNEISFDVPGQGPMEFTVEIEGDELIQTEKNTGQRNVLVRRL
ncbi:hypothetical protein NBRC116494_35570 [Aurantivibrio plasticivorans]